MKRFSGKKEKEDLFEIISDDESQITPDVTAPHTLTVDEVLGGNTTDSKKTANNSHKALDALKKRMIGEVENEKKETNLSEKIEEISKVSETDTTHQKTEIKSEKSTLMDKCMPFLIDEDGTEADINCEPLYKLQSVAEILKSDSEKVLERLSQKYDIAFDDLNGTTSLLKDIKKQEEIKEEEKIPIKSEKEITKEPVEVSNTQKIVISDIDMPITQVEKPKNDQIINTSTITFTPVTDNSNRKINISTHTRSIDLTGEFANIPTETKNENSDEVKLEKNEFEEFIPDDELKTEKDAGRLIRKFSIIKRKYFISSFISVITTLILSLNWIPPIQKIILSNTAITMMVCAGIMLIAVLFNLNCFKELKNIFGHNSKPDIAVALSIPSVALYSVFGILNKEIIVEILIFLGVILSFRSIGEFLKASSIITNLKIAISPAPKNTLKLINDSAITYTMAESFTDGEALIADTQTAQSISDFMKYSTHGAFLSGKMPIITAISLILSIITGIVCAFYFDGIVYGFYAAAVIQCLTALPSAFLIDNLPLSRATKKLSRKGAMILGKTGADAIEMANAVVIDADKLFPSGSVTLHQMQALSSNNLEDTIIRAASLTECLGSTLAPIFKTIAGTGNIDVLPDSDTVKYEDKMGISGWVDNRLLFIGNRALLETHGIPVPSLEIDRKILRQGYFPVYVATQNRACALIIIQYNVKPEIAKELRRLTDSGVDLLVSSCDPNLTEEMICDYFGLYNDSVKIMTAAGRHTHRNVTAAAKTVSCPAVCGKGSVGIAMVLNCASRIKKSNLLLSIAYILSAILGTVIFAYSSFGGSGTLLTPTTVLLYLLISTIVSFILYLIKRP